MVGHKIPIEIDDKSDVVENIHADKFPPDIIDAIFNVNVVLNESTDEMSSSDTDLQPKIITTNINKSTDKVETFYYFLVSSYFHFKSCKTIKY